MAFVHIGDGLVLAAAQAASCFRKPVLFRSLAGWIEWQYR